MVTKTRYFGTIAVLAAALFSAQAAHATGEHCTNDIDCKTGPSCGGEICDWEKAMTCQPATASGSGKEGWCTVDTDCKCAAQGATCDKTMFQCTKTVAASGTGGAGGAGAGGSGSSAGGSSAAGSSAAGSSAAGPSASSDSSSSSGGCSFAGVAPRGSLNLALGAACAVGLAFARRRKRVAS